MFRSSLGNFRKCISFISFPRNYMSMTSAWSAVPLGPRDPILGITEAYQADLSDIKINVGVGAYRDDSGHPYILDCVKKAEILLPEIYKEKEYVDISGLPSFKEVTLKLAYGDQNMESLSNIAVCQSLSGTGALRLGGVFLNRFSKSKGIYLPSPTWGNHVNIFKDSGLVSFTYRYWNNQKKCLDIEGMIEDIKMAPNESIILLHACAHNPTGIDPSLEQWDEIRKVILSKGHTVFMDMAYQGFASGNPDKDAYAVRSFTEHKVPLLVAQSFSKNFGLYGERIGAISIPCASAKEAEAVLSQLKIIARPMYSSPPIHGARLVSLILGHHDLHNLWLDEIKIMADRIISMRKALRLELETLQSRLNWDHITNQIGMFCYTGLNPEQVQRLTDEFHVYLTKDARISMAGINSGNVKRLAFAIHSVTM